MNTEEVDQFCLELQGDYPVLAVNDTVSPITTIKITTSPKIELEDFLFGRLATKTLITTEIVADAGTLTYMESRGEIHNVKFSRR